MTTPREALREIGSGVALVFSESTYPHRQLPKSARCRYVSSVFNIGLPWPMTRDRGTLLLLVPLVFVLGGGILVAWAAATFIEPALWRLVLPIAWILLSRTIVRLIVRLRAPDDVDQRWAEIREFTAQLSTRHAPRS